MERTGSCGCGAIHFRVVAEPLGTGACHCTDCQKFSGGGPNYVALLPKGTLEVTRGEPHVYLGKGDSGGAVERAFCPDCGTPLWSIPEHAPFFTVKVGAFDHNKDLEPKMHIYVASAPDWHPISANRPTFRKMSPENGVPG